MYVKSKRTHMENVWTSWNTLFYSCCIAFFSSHFWILWKNLQISSCTEKVRTSYDVGDLICTLLAHCSWTVIIIKQLILSLSYPWLLASSCLITFLHIGCTPPLGSNSVPLYICNFLSLSFSFLMQWLCFFFV